MSDFADLLVAITGLIGTLGGTFALVWNTVVRRREPAKEAAKQAAVGTAEKLLDAVADGEITAAELDELRRALKEEQ